MLAGDAQASIAERDVPQVPPGASDADARKEKRANAFAAALLMPQPLVVAVLDGAVLDRVVYATLVTTIQVFPSAMAWRLVGLGLAEREVVELWSRGTTEACMNSMSEVAAFKAARHRSRSEHLPPDWWTGTSRGSSSAGSRLALWRR